MLNLNPINTTKTSSGPIQKEKLVIKQVLENSMKDLKGHIMNYKIIHIENDSFHQKMKHEFLKNWIWHTKLDFLNVKRHKFVPQCDNETKVDVNSDSDEVYIVKGKTPEEIETLQENVRIPSKYDKEQNEYLEMIVSSSDLLFILIHRMIKENRWSLAKKYLKQSKRFKSIDYIYVKRFYRKMLRKGWRN